MQKNDEVTLNIHDLTTDGAGIGKYSGMTVFVAGALPGEQVLAKIILVKKNYCVGKLLEIITPSANRTTPPCPYFQKCGGCTLQHLDYSGQLEYKTNYVKNCLSRIGNVDVNVNDCIASPNVFNYRNKASFPVKKVDGKAAVGLYSKRSHDVVSIEKCMLQEEACNDALKVIVEFINQYSIEPYDEITQNGLLRHVIIRTAHDGSVMAGLVINGNKFNFTQEFIEYMTQNIKNLKSLMLNINTNNTNVIMGEKSICLYGDDFLTEKLCDKFFKFSLNSFLQVNRLQTEKIYSKALSYLPKQGSLLDLYCGIGTIAIIGARGMNRVLGIEIAETAIANAVDNSLINNIANADFICADVSNLPSISFPADSVIVDPPRRGLNEKVIANICAMTPANIVYISCDAATLARDLALFVTNGYTVVDVSPFDMFPNTTHVECVVYLKN